MGEGGDRRRNLRGEKARRIERTADGEPIIAFAGEVLSGRTRRGAAIERAEARAQIAGKRVRRLDDARFDHDLAHRHVDLAHERPHLLEPRRGVLHEEGVGARIDDRATAPRQDSLLLVGQDFLKRIRLLVVQLEGFGAHRLDVGNLRLRFERQFFLGRQFVARRNPDDVAVLAHVQTLGLQNDVERLVPRHVFQPEREVAADGVAGDEVEAREIGDHLQNRANLDVLEVERKLLAGIADARALDQLGGVFEYRFDLDDKAVVGLVRRMLPQALGLD